ncbi:MAG TPA: KpsF/GutQ family sugar-phosphate isomerase [Armatimonadota bacterium]|nr:KpsF/GutQ family sugar-phosphate isomerase [Armatimonadota bacterium]
MVAGARKVSRQVILEQARETLRLESEAVACLVDRLGDSFIDAVELLLATSGRVIVTGIGKSGAVGNKLAGTLASTGTPAYFMHAAEAVHGDLGMVNAEDVAIMITNSGETEELVRILPVIKRRGAKIIAICGNEHSTVGKAADVALDASVEREACPLGLAPTSSALAELAMGDALAMAVMRARGFTMDEYGQTHPGGQLGRRVLLRVEDLMHGGEDNPTVGMDATVEEALLTMSTAVVRGAVSIVGEDQKLRGLFTDGDFRVLMQKVQDRNEVMSRPIVEVMTKKPTIVKVGTLGVVALRIMDEREFDNIPVVDEEGRVVGILDVQDLMKAGIV